VLKLFASLIAASAAAALGGEPGSAVSFQRDIAPILQRRCVNCHNEDSSKGGFRLDTFAALQKPGDSEASPIIPGKPEGSEIHRLLVTADPDERMPQKADALPSEELEVIKRWIEEGAAYDGGDANRSVAELVRDFHLRPAPTKYARPVPITALAFNGDGRRLAVSGYREVLIWNTPEGTLARRIGGMPERITSLAWQPQKNLLAVAGGTPGQWGTVALIDVTNRYRVRFLCDLPELVLSAEFSKDGSTLVAGAGDRALRIFDTSSGKTTKVLRLHADWVQDVAFNPDGTRLVTASRDRTARVLDTADWHQITSYQGHDTGLLAAAFSRDGSRVITTARNSGHIWHPEQGNKRGDLLEIGPDARQLVSGTFGIAAGGSDGALRFYQGEGKEPWLVLKEHHDAVQSVTVSRNGDLLASGSADGEVIVWSPSCWAPVTRFFAVP
jgi:WD40 repeat protein